MEELGQLFNGVFGYAIWPYRIPSLDSQRALGVCVAEFVKSFGGDDKLIIVYYGGHGGLNVTSKSPCTWAALVQGGPTVYRSIIQPLLFGAGCDVAIFLDCCFAGQAARSHTSHSIEFLAATDKDQMTPSGSKTWPSFTKVLMHEMEKMTREGFYITLPELARRLVAADSGLRRQPFYVPLGGSNSVGSITLSKLQRPTETSNSEDQILSAASLSIRLSLFSQLDLGTAEALIKWMTRDSPSHISNIQLADQVLTDATGANALGLELINQRPQDGNMLPYLSKEGQLEAARLLHALKTALSHPSSPQLTDVEATSILSNLDKMRSNTTCETESLKDRIAMRLNLLGEDVQANNIRVSFESPSKQDQRLRGGKKNGVSVLVEYYYPQIEDEKAWADLSQQVAKVSALQCEPKGENFRILPGLGFLSESLIVPRFGFVYKLPENRLGCKYIFLSDLLDQVKVVPLNIRVRTASALCEAVINLHSVGWYHKGIKSENVIIFESAASCNTESKDTYVRWDFANPYFVGFDCSRPAEAETRGTVDFLIRSNIYRHPERWGRSMRFERHHDLYALGILLVEIACWKTLPSMDSKRSNFDHIQNPEKLMSFLLRVADEKVSHAAGTEYAEGLRSCRNSREWKQYENWQFQNLVRDKVLRPLRALSGDHI
ncbi:hypothetical protein HYALB_00012254 [Hymenoscyphus albidus]|uniref:Protein kinase domain-containing protein n=1 Tax=Hymenoscyphus albidus TaxID=595503 RepID=A0A9N9LUR6_9HELO|nr:hypothetical protein HYALB_00012254 [Hymenoscyphus albidus]